MFITLTIILGLASVGTGRLTGTGRPAPALVTGNCGG